MNDIQLSDLVRAGGGLWCLDMSLLPRYITRDTAELKRRLPRMDGAVAVIPVDGVLTPKGSHWTTSTERIGRAVEAAMAHRQITGVVLDVDSPGGSGYGLMEFADKLHSMRSVKPIVAQVNPIAASAALWTASAASRIVVTPSGDIGSLGVYSMHVDYSGALAAEGVAVTFIHAAKYKVEGNPYQPLTDEAREEIQRGVDELYGDFVSAVARNRGVSRAHALERFGEGRLLSATKAVSVGLADRVGTLADTLREVGATDGDVRRSANDALPMLMAAWNGEPLSAVKVRYTDAATRNRARRKIPC